MGKTIGYFSPTDWQSLAGLVGLMNEGDADQVISVILLVIMNYLF